MRLGLVVAGALALAACRSERTPRFRASGTLVHNGLTDDDKAGWATELEVLRSRAMLDEVAADLAGRGVTVPVAEVQRGISATRRGHSRVIVVAVASDDRELARRVCTGLIEHYIAHGLEASSAAERAGEAAASRRLDELRRNLVVDGNQVPERVAEYERELARWKESLLHGPSLNNDVLVLDGCRVEGT